MKKLFFTLFFIIVCLDTAQAQSCKKSTPTAPNTRYELLNNGSEVKDIKTNLIWQRCSVGQTWSGTGGCTGAVTYKGHWLYALSLAGGEWRIPNIKELSSLVERACFAPAINESIFPNTQSSVYWSSSPTAMYGGSDVWVVDFSNGYIYNDVQFLNFYIRLVRSAQ